ncbi:hypothetical protein L0V05_00900 [Tabrizicola sp. J26]|uniref:hypothetical protein n=1 Tax=Alitabrizicola rongguiensis TaxID=2909234 RepID=UPI001F20513F|nr:hypothetical protein [Tabrizicola rongguiensis]MCF1707363.1 hypothetical protein [Tabrizicola rongguiensis]
MHYGFCCTFPFAIFCELDAIKWTVCDIKFEDVRLRISPPFRSESYLRRGSPDFDYWSSPILKERSAKTPEQYSRPFSVYPTLTQDVHGKTKATVVVRDDARFESLPLNSIQFDIFTTDENEAHALFEKVKSRGLRNIKRGSHQYWILQNPSYFESDLKSTFCADENYTIHEPPWSSTFIVTPSKLSKPISHELWQKSWIDASTSQPIDWLDYLLEAEHYSASKEKEKSLMQLALSLELLKSDLWEALNQAGKCSRREMRKAQDSTQEIYHYFADNLYSACGDSIERFDRDSFASIKQIWMLRGLIAHGRAERVSSMVGQRLDDIDFETLIEGVLGAAYFVEHVRRSL